MSIGWRDDYLIGHPEIDHDHRVLVDVIQSLSTGYCDNDLVDTQIKILERYITEHFAREERLMRSIDFPDIDSHLLHHKQFRNYVRQLRAEWAASNTHELQHRIVTELSRWLENHILVADRDYGAWLRK